MSNKNLKLLLPLISGLLTGISFIIPYFGFICFFSIVPLFYSILYCNNNLAFSSVFIFSFAFSLTSDIWFMNIGNDLTDNKLYAFFISLSIILLVSFVLALFHSIPFSIYKYIVSSKCYFIELFIYFRRMDFRCLSANCFSLEQIMQYSKRDYSVYSICVSFRRIIYIIEHFMHQWLSVCISTFFDL